LSQWFKNDIPRLEHPINTLPDSLIPITARSSPLLPSFCLTPVASPSIPGRELTETGSSNSRSTSLPTTRLCIPPNEISIDRPSPTAGSSCRSRLRFIHLLTRSQEKREDRVTEHGGIDAPRALACTVDFGWAGKPRSLFAQKVGHSLVSAKYTWLV
jgi:hypothetical protein